MNQWRIRTKILLLALLPGIITTVSLAGLFLHTRFQDLEAMLQERGEAQARQLATAAEYGVFTGNRALLLTLTNAALEERDVRSVTIFDRRRQVIGHSGPSLLDPPGTRASLVDQLSRFDMGDIVRFSAPVHMQDVLADDVLALGAPDRKLASREPIGWVVVELSRVPTHLEKMNTLMRVAFISLAGLGTMVWLALLVSRQIGQPIRQIIQAVEQIGDGKLDTRVYTRSSPEFVALENGVNAMAEALARSTRDMQAHIDQATRDLQETLETIEIQNIDLDMARRAAIEASRVKSEFLANMSHEIRTPLNGIIGFTKLLLRSRLTNQQREQLSTILKSSEVLLTIINDILDFSKIEAGKLVLDSAPLDLRDIMEDVLTMLAPSAHEKNLDLALLVYEDVPTRILGDALRIKQIITNLVSNAIKFTQSGEVVVRAELEDREDENRTWIRISVQDTGVGLSRIQRDTLFNAFSQADASTARRFGGTGLGLVICKRLIKQMGGDIDLESELGKGSTFWISLPAKVIPDTAAPSTENLLVGEKAVYLEHQPRTGLAVGHLLNHLGLDVTCVDDSETLLRTLRAAQAEGQGFGVAILGITRHHLLSSRYRKLVQEIEMELDCRTLILHPTLEESGTLPDLLKLASAYVLKPPKLTSLADALTQILRGEHPSAVSAPEQPALPASGPDVPHVLAVDDNPANLKLIEAFLRELQVQVTVCNSGYEAIKLSRQHHFDLVFMDVQMPGMDGIETTQRLREDTRQRHLPVVALTAHALSEERDMLLRSGFDDYLAKPIDENRLREVITRFTGFRFDAGEDEAETDDSRGGKRFSPSRRTASACFDAEESIRLSGGRTELAEELFCMMLDALPDDRRKIESAWQAGDRDALKAHTHKLHGATRYCGVPALRESTYTLETCLKTRPDEAGPLVTKLLEEIDRLSVWAERNDWQSLLRARDDQDQARAAGA
ncbi:response regulator [Hahella sp. SMD15-11]|uniref:histidine kinase n=1 Tax=Thermohahella caldifontis TaxID=3142973 RepID=A0AB39V023_9GAMM